MLPVSEWPIIQTDDGYFRRVNHAERLLTTGFLTEAKMIEYTPLLRTDEAIRKLMAARYAEAFGSATDQVLPAAPNTDSSVPPTDAPTEGKASDMDEKDRRIAELKREVSELKGALGRALKSHGARAN